MPRPVTVLVAGATGRQGGALAHLLLEKGHAVRALTRHPGSPAAAALEAAGAELRPGDLEDPGAVERAAAGADAFFLMATPFEGGVEAEERQATRAADAARAAGVRHLVYSSVAGADRGTGVPHFDSKLAVEEHVRGLGVPFTIVAPVYFMENFLAPAAVEALRTGKLALPLRARRRLQLVAVADLAAFVRLVLERASEFRDRRVELAGDELTGSQLASALSRATGSTIAHARVRLSEVRARSEDLGRMFEWLDEVGYSVDLAGLRRDYPEVGWHDFGQWAREQDWSVLDEASPEQPTA
jgi:uncharacterized protein YbjT (DUF2867 family)